jgi:protoporphyrinogen/coproporphyrinogen III oxidase
VTLELIESLGISDMVIPVHRSHVAAKNRMVYAKNQLCMLPNGPSGIFKTIPPFSKPLFFAGIKDIFTGKSKTPLRDESLYDFVERRFGREIADFAISPVVCGICAGDAKEISVKFLFKEIFEKEQQFGGVIKGIIKSRRQVNKQEHHQPIYQSDFVKRSQAEGWSLYRMQDGIEVIPWTIYNKLKQNKNFELHLDSPCEKISFTNEEVICSVNGSLHSSKHLISTLPAFSLAKLLSAEHSKLSEELNKIQYVDVAVINLSYNNEDLLKEKGFGVLIAPSENLPVCVLTFFVLLQIFIQ